MAFIRFGQCITPANCLRAERHAFDAFSGATSTPFEPGLNKSVAVTVIDPRGNEVMKVRKIA